MATKGRKDHNELAPTIHYEGWIGSDLNKKISWVPVP
jgi:hypothetical protein